MQIYLTEHFTVEKVVDGVAHVSARIPAECADDLLALADYLIHVSRRFKTKSRVCVAIAPRPSGFKRIIG